MFIIFVLHFLLYSFDRNAHFFHFPMYTIRIMYVGWCRLRGPVGPWRVLAVWRLPLPYTIFYLVLSEILSIGRCLLIAGVCSSLHRPKISFTLGSVGAILGYYQHLSLFLGGMTITLLDFCMLIGLPEGYDLPTMLELSIEEFTWLFGPAGKKFTSFLITLKVIEGALRSPPTGSCACQSVSVICKCGSTSTSLVVLLCW